AGRPSHLRGADGRGEPQARAGGTEGQGRLRQGSRMDRGAVPGRRRVPHATGRDPVGRSATTARDRTRAGRTAERAPPRRAVARAGSDHGRRRPRGAGRDPRTRSDRAARRTAGPAHGCPRRPHVCDDERRDQDDPPPGGRGRHRSDRRRLHGLVTHVQSLIDAIGVGALYALIAVGIGLVFGVLRLINFAYGQLIMLAAYALAFTDSWPDAASIVVAALVAVAASLVLERVAFRPVRPADAPTMLVATLAVAYLLQNAALLQYPSRQRGGLGDPVGTLAQLNRAVTIGSLNIRWATFLAIGASLVSLAGLALLLNRTSIGLPMRAAAMDFRTSRPLGVRADTVIMVAVAAAGVLAAIVAVILSITSPLVNPTTGLNETLIVLVGVVAGGIDRLTSATLGGFAIGFATSFVGSELPTSGTTPFTSNVYMPSVIYLAVIVVLLLRPQGLFARAGQGSVERV